MFATDNGIKDQITGDRKILLIHSLTPGALCPGTFSVDPVARRRKQLVRSDSPTAFFCQQKNVPAGRLKTGSLAPVFLTATGGGWSLPFS